MIVEVSLPELYRFTLKNKSKINYMEEKLEKLPQQIEVLAETIRGQEN